MLIILTLSCPVENLQLLDAGLFKYVWLFVPPCTKGLRERNICKTKNFEIKVCELNLENEKNVEIFRMSRFLLHLLFYLWALFYFGEYREKGTQDPEGTQDPGLYEDPGPYEVPGPYDDPGPYEDPRPVLSFLSNTLFWYSKVLYFT